MHPVALAALSGAGLMAGGVLLFIALGLHELHSQERAYRQYAHHAQEARPAQADDEAGEDRLLGSVYEEVQQELGQLRRLPPGEARRSAVRQLKRRYHPDRFPRSLRGILTQVSAFINLQTQGLS